MLTKTISLHSSRVKATKIGSRAQVRVIKATKDPQTHTQTLASYHRRRTAYRLRQAQTPARLLQATNRNRGHLLDHSAIMVRTAAASLPLLLDLNEPIRQASPTTLRSPPSATRPQRAYQASFTDDTEKLDGSQVTASTDQYAQQDAYYGEEYDDRNWESEQIGSGDAHGYGADVHFVIPRASTLSKHICNRRQTTFTSRNLLYKHLRQICWQDTSQSSNHVVCSDKTSAIVTSTVVSDQSKANADYAFRNWHYGTARLRLKPMVGEHSDALSVHPKVMSNKDDDGCVDSGCPVTLGDRSFIDAQLGSSIKDTQTCFSTTR